MMHSKKAPQNHKLTDQAPPSVPHRNTMGNGNTSVPHRNTMGGHGEGSCCKAGGAGLMGKSQG